MVDNNSNSGDFPTPATFTEQTTNMTETLNKVSASTPTVDVGVAPIGIKLDGSNYPLWSQVVEIYISAKDKLGYINDSLPQPSQTDSTFRQWRTNNAIVKGWLINSMEASLISIFIRYPTTKQVWDTIATTFSDRSDTPQVYEPCRQKSKLKQVGCSLEKFYDELQGLWRSKSFKIGSSSASNVGSLALNSNRSNVNSHQMEKINTEGTKCFHYGNTNHTHDTCFKLHGYSDWWHELQAKKSQDGATNDTNTGKAVVTVADRTCPPLRSNLPPLIQVWLYSGVIAVMIATHGFLIPEQLTI